MINHHPNSEILNAFVIGDLPASLAAAVAMHNDMCSTCKYEVRAMTELQVENDFESNQAAKQLLTIDDIDIEQMISDITAVDTVEPEYENVAVTMNVKGQSYKLPRAIQHMPIGRWNSMGKLTRARMDLDEGEVHTSLLQIEAGGSVPQHTHKGFELTLLLEGTFKDEMGEYVAGDFIMLDGTHEHQPTTEQGCLCYTVADAAQHFTQGINKLLNPIGSLIY
jgi:putative transcriptional regulator